MKVFLRHAWGMEHEGGRFVAAGSAARGEDGAGRLQDFSRGFARVVVVRRLQRYVGEGRSGWQRRRETWCRGGCRWMKRARCGGVLSRDGGLVRGGGMPFGVGLCFLGTGYVD